MEDIFANFIADPLPKKEISIWAEKYRPKSLDDYIGNEMVLNFINRCISQQELTDHVLFYGPAGTGKTTAAKLLVNSLPCDYIYVNASDKTGVDFVREDIRGFAHSVGFSNFKIVILDEFDYMSQNSQAALRNMLEVFASHTRFIFTCNYIHKIIDPIKSRCQKIEVKPSSLKELMIKLAKILIEENIKFEPKDVAFIVNKYHPDLRSIIKYAQRCSYSGELKIDSENLVESNVKEKIIDLLKSPKKTTFNDMRQFLADSGISEYSDLYTHLYEQVSEYAGGKEALAVIYIAESLYQSSVVIPNPLSQEVMFMALINKLLDCINKKL